MVLRAFLLAVAVAIPIAISPLAVGEIRSAEIRTPAAHKKASEANDKVDAYWPTDPVLCDITLDGNIEQGDLKKLQEGFEAIVDSMNSFSFFLCLRSGGGDLGEAIKIAQFVLDTQRPSIATVVEDGQTCASSCAIIFLAGNAPARVGSWPQRFLHARGRLLYHSSRIDLSDLNEKDLLARLNNPADPRGLRGQISDLYKGGLRDVQGVISTFQKGTFQRENQTGAWVRPSLFLEIFAQDPDEWLCIDDVDSVGRWNIQVFGYTPPVALKDENYKNLCRNAYHWRQDKSAREDESGGIEVGAPRRVRDDAAYAGRSKKNTAFDERRVIDFQATYAPLKCVIELPSGADRRISKDQSTIETFFVHDSSDGNTSISTLAPVAYYAPDALLAELPGVRNLPKTEINRKRTLVPFLRHKSRSMLGCSYKRLLQSDESSCESACAVDAWCKAYSYEISKRTCDLKHTMTAVRLDPLSVTGVPSSDRAPAQSVRSERMVNYRSESGSAVSLTGDVLVKAKGEDLDQCVSRCVSDPSCVALSQSNEICETYSRISGLVLDSSDSADGPIVQFKRQK